MPQPRAGSNGRSGEVARVQASFPRGQKTPFLTHCVRNAELCIESSSTTPTHTGLNDVPGALSHPLPSIDWYPRQVPPRVVAQHGHSGMHTLTCSTFLFLCGILPRTVGGAGSCGATFGWGDNVDRRCRRQARPPHHRCWRGAWADGHAALRRGRRRNIIPGARVVAVFARMQMDRR